MQAILKSDNFVSYFFIENVNPKSSIVDAEAKDITLNKKNHFPYELILYEICNFRNELVFEVKKMIFFWIQFVFFFF